MLSFLLMRSPFEPDVFFQFTIGSVLICAIWVYLGSPTPVIKKVRSRLRRRRDYRPGAMAGEAGRP
jgi:hypothetical protein